MSGVNKAIIVGRLGKDPELRYTQAGKAVCNLSLATSEKWKDQTGEQQERTEWHKVTVWGKSAEACSKYLSKGDMAFVEGRLETQEWEDRDGNKRYTTQIVASDVKFLSTKGQGRSESRNPAPAPAGDDDIPF